MGRPNKCAINSVVYKYENVMMGYERIGNASTVKGKWEKTWGMDERTVHMYGAQCQL